MRRFEGSLPPHLMRCSECRARPAVLCVGCGTPLKGRAQKRCGSCHAAYREANRKPGVRQFVDSNGVAVTDPRATQAWRRLRARVIEEEPYCQLGFPGICTVVSTTGDHIVPVRRDPSLALVRSNVRGSCKECNEMRRTIPDAALIKRPQGPQIRRGVRGGLPR